MKIIPKTVLCTMFCLCLIGIFQMGWGYQRVEARSGSIKIESHYDLDDGTHLSITGDYFSLYKIAARQEYHYVNEGAFQSFPEIPFERTREAESKLIHELGKKIENEKILPLQEGLTDCHGELFFTDLEEGLYLIQKDTKKAQDKSYISDPFLIELPLEEPDGVLYNITVIPKYSPNDGDHPVTEEAVSKDSTESKNAETGLKITDQRIWLAVSMGLSILVLSVGLGFKILYLRQRDQ